jgi:hypothetical protein
MKTSSATHILVEPDLSGWRYITTIEEQETTIRHGHSTVAELVHYCPHRGLPVLVENGTQAWCDQTAARLRNKGVVVLTDEENCRLYELDLYWLNRCQVGDRIQFEAIRDCPLWGGVVAMAKGERPYLEVLPDNWTGTMFVAGREVLTLTVEGPKL